MTRDRNAHVHGRHVYCDMTLCFYARRKSNPSNFPHMQHILQYYFENKHDTVLVQKQMTFPFLFYGEKSRKEYRNPWEFWEEQFFQDSQNDQIDFPPSAGDLYKKVGSG